MPRACTVCHHASCRRIDAAIASGTPIRGISRTYRVSEDALQRHKQHVATAIVTAAERRGEHLADSLYDQMREMLGEARGLLAKMKVEGDWRGGIAAVKTMGELLEKLDDMLEKSNVKGETVRWVVEAIGAPRVCPHCGTVVETEGHLTTDYRSPS